MAGSVVDPARHREPVAGRDRRSPAGGRSAASRASSKLHALHTLRPRKGSAYKVNVKLDPGKWKLRVRYRDPGAVLPATSRAVSVSVR